MDKFDYGLGEEESFGYNNRHIWPSDGMHTLLLDADSIPYIVGYTSSDEEYINCFASPNGFEGSEIFLDKLDHANWLLNEWVRKSKADSVVCYVTDSSSNFRLKIADYYKAQRTDDPIPKPPFFYEIKEWLIEEHKAILSNGNEADDEVSIEAWERHKANGFDRRTSDFTIGSMDKDLQMIPGWHVNYDTGEKYWVDLVGELSPVFKEREVTNYEYHPLFNGDTVDFRDCMGSSNLEASSKICGEDLEQSGIDVSDKWSLSYIWRKSGQEQDTYTRGKNKGTGKFKRVKAGIRTTEYIDKLRGTGLKFFYSQILTGDAVDNYPGLEGCGKQGAFDALNNITTEWGLYQTTLALYINKYGEEERAKAALLEQGQLAWMQTYPGELWQLPETPEHSSYPNIGDK